jgi:hypothetical protein
VGSDRCLGSRSRAERGSCFPNSDHWAGLVVCFIVRSVRTRIRQRDFDIGIAGTLADARTRTIDRNATADDQVNGLHLSYAYAPGDVRRAPVCYLCQMSSSVAANSRAASAGCNRSRDTANW